MKKLARKFEFVSKDLIGSDQDAVEDIDSVVG